MVRLDLDRTLDLDHRHRGAAAEQLGQMAFVRWVQVGGHDEREAAVRWHGAKQFLQRLEPARRGADPDDWKLGHACPRNARGSPPLNRATPLQTATSAVGVARLRGPSMTQPANARYKKPRVRFPREAKAAGPASSHR
jgi:hypothetical protein